MAQAAVRPMTVTEFLEWNPGDGRRYELIGGVPLAMTPPSVNHARLTTEIGALLREALSASDCYVSEGLGVATPSREGQVLIPDVIVSCESIPAASRLAREPQVIIEVFSPSIQDWDRPTRLPAYMSLPTVQEIALVDSTAQFVEVYRRHQGKRWYSDLLQSATDEIALPSLDLRIPLSAIYADLEVQSSGGLEAVG